MKIEINPKRVLIEAETADEEGMVKEFVEYSNFAYSLRRFLGLEKDYAKPALARAMTLEEAEAYRKRLGRFMTVIEMHGYDDKLFNTIRLSMEAVGKTFAERGMIKSCRTDPMIPEEEN